METCFLILTAALAFTWLAGAVLVWWNLRRQERLIGSLYQLTARLLVEPPQFAGPSRRKRHQKAAAPADDIGVDYALRTSRAACTSPRSQRRSR
jgi:hypothetical protein